MPFLDVSDVLQDPDFMSSGLICKRTAVIVGSNGRAQTTLTNLTFDAVVTTNNGFQLDRKPDGTIIKGAINIHTQFVLIPGDQDHQADEITWQGKNYIVHQVLSNTQYGNGFIKAICILKPVTG